MPRIIYPIIFFIMLFSLLANPAPVTIEIDDLILIALPCLIAVLIIARAPAYMMYKTESNLVMAVMIYLSYLFISMLFGLLHGVSILNVLRSIGPYVNFFPLLFLGLLPARKCNPWIIAIIMVTIGLLQACYHFYLYSIHANAVVSTIGVLRSRITLIEPRTTLPIVLAIATLPMAFFMRNKPWVTFVAAALCLTGFFAAAATLTRSVILSILFGWLTFIVLFIYKQYRLHSYSIARLILLLFNYLLILMVSILLISLIPKVQMLEQGLLARFYYHASSHSTDYSNGRLYDEWIPALKAWLNSDTLSLFFGIGAGNTFRVATGEERTYIHNLSIYSLVYGGFFGFFACLWLYFTILRTLVIRALQTDQTIFLSFAALLASLFFYGQLFAVHKGLAFNAMLFLIIAMALIVPLKEN